MATLWRGACSFLLGLSGLGFSVWQSKICLSCVLGECQAARMPPLSRTDGFASGRILFVLISLHANTGHEYTRDMWIRMLKWMDATLKGP